MTNQQQINLTVEPEKLAKGADSAIWVVIFGAALISLYVSYTDLKKEHSLYLSQIEQSENQLATLEEQLAELESQSYESGQGSKTLEYKNAWRSQLPVGLSKYKILDAVNQYQSTDIQVKEVTLAQNKLSIVMLSNIAGIEVFTNTFINDSRFKGLLSGSIDISKKGTGRYHIRIGGQ